MAERVALYLQDRHSLQDGIKYAQYAESKGFEAVWQAESRLVRDAIVPMAAFAATTKSMKVGSGVINNWTRNIGLLAATFLTLDDLAPDRIICGIGAWWDPLAKNVGIDRKKPLLAMRETIEVMRRLLQHGARDVSRRVSHVDRHRAGCGAWPQRAAQCADHDWRDRRPDDGADRRDCRWLRDELLRPAGIQRSGDGVAGQGRARKRAGGWTIWIAHNWSCVR